MRLACARNRAVVCELPSASDRRCSSQAVVSTTGAAFDLPEEVAAQLLAAGDELSVRGITLDKPDSLPAEQLVLF
jgi:hypothetical protein